MDIVYFQLEKANEQFIKPLEHFRKQHIVQAKVCCDSCPDMFNILIKYKRLTLKYIKMELPENKNFIAYNSRGESEKGLSASLLIYT